MLLMFACCPSTDTNILSNLGGGEGGSGGGREWVCGGKRIEDE